MATPDQAVPPTFTAPTPAPDPAAQAIPQLANQQATAVQIPTGGYASRFVRIALPQFALPGVPEPWIEIRNPGMMAQQSLDEIGTALGLVETGPDGEPVAADTEAILRQMQRLIRAWCMWDAVSDDDVPPPLPAPSELATLRRAPSGALVAVMKAFMELQDPR
jgi:hypothetical protein